MADEQAIKNFNPAAYLANSQGSSLPSSNVPVDDTQIDQFNPTTYLARKNHADYLAKQQAYGSLPQEALTALEGAGTGALPYVFTKAELATGLTTPEDIAGRAEASPWIHGGFNAAGTGALMYVTGGLGNVAGATEAAGLGAKAVQAGEAAAKAAASSAEAVGAGELAGNAALKAGATAEAAQAASQAAEAAYAAKIGRAAEIATAGSLRATAAKVAGHAVEGAALGAGNVANEYALDDNYFGDPSLAAQKIISNLGYGALFGGSFGLLARGIEGAPALSRAIPKFGSTIDAAEQTPLEQIQSKIKNASYQGYGVEAPQMADIEDAMSNVKMNNEILPQQLDKYKNPDAVSEWDVYKNTPGEASKTVLGYENVQKQELNGKTDALINELHPERKPISDPVGASEDASKDLTQNIQNIRDEAGPLIGELKKTQIQENHAPGVIDYLTKSNPEIAKIFDTSGESIKIKPYDYGMGLSEKAYKNISNMVKDLQKDPTDFTRLFNLRENLSNGVSATDLDKTALQIGNAKKAMMDYIQDKIQSMNPDQQVREAFKRYAINEQNASILKRKLGIGEGKPVEKVLDKIFRDTENVKAAKAISTPEQFAKMRSNYLANLKAEATKDGVFSSNKFGSALRKDGPVLDEAFKENPHALQELKRQNVLARLFPDAPPVNPSGTAKTLAGVLKPGMEVLGGPKVYALGVLERLKDYGKDIFKDKMQMAKLNAHLAGQADQVTKFQQITKLLQKSTKQISSSVKDIFSSDYARGAIIKSGINITEPEFKERTQKIKELLSSPETTTQHLENSTGNLYASAPNITQSIHNTMVAGLQFLNSKIPGPSQHLPLSGEYKTPQSEMVKFNKYYNAVENPISSLDQVKSGGLTNETMEALQAVHPQLLDEMRKTVMSELDTEKAKKLEYSVKMSLAKFLGQPLDEHMLPPVITSNQQALQGPQLGQQAPSRRQQSTLGGLKELKLSERSATDTMKTETSENI